jgi:hypothetical protein
VSARYEAREKYALGFVSLEKGLAALNQFRVAARRRETESFWAGVDALAKTKDHPHVSTQRRGEYQRAEQQRH